MNKKLDEVRVLELMAIIIVTALANIILICTKVAPYVNHLALFGFFKTLLSMGTIYFIVSCALFAVSIVATCYLFLYSDISHHMDLVGNYCLDYKIIYGYSESVFAWK